MQIIHVDVQFIYCTFNILVCRKMSKTGLVIVNCRTYVKKPTINYNQPVFGIGYEINYIQNIYLRHYRKIHFTSTSMIYRNE